MFKHDSLPSKIYSYHVYRIVENDDLLQEQFLIAHRHQNALVEIERARRAAVDAKLPQMFPELAAVENDLAAAEEAVELKEVEVKRQNAEARRRTGTREQREELARLREIRKQLRASRKELRAAAFASEAWAAARAAINAPAEARKKVLRKTTGLYWGTYLQVEGRVKRSGRPPRFKRWDGKQTLAVQLQHGMTWDEAVAGADTRLRVQQVPGRRQYRCRLRIGSNGRQPIFGAVDFLMHRPLPPGCRIKWLYLCRRRRAHHVYYRIQFVISREEGFPRDDWAADGAVGVNLGWRSVPGGLRVAYWFGSDGREGQLILPDRILADLAIAKERQSASDKRFNLMRNALTKWLRESEPSKPDWLIERTRFMSHWRSAARLYGVREAWRAARFPGDEEIFAALDAWAAWSRRSFDAHRARMVSFLDRRAALYRKFAADLSKEYRIVRLGAVDLRKFAAAADCDSEDSIYQNSRRQAATSLLDGFLIERFAGSSRFIATNITKRCHFCGHLNRFDAAAAINHTCTGCNETWDQDANASRTLQAGGWPGTPLVAAVAVSAAQIAGME